MRGALVGSTMLFGLIGCQHALNQVCTDSRGAADTCPAESPGRPQRCTAPQVEVQAPGEIEVRAPRQKVVVDVPPAACQAPAPAPCAPAPCAPAMQVPNMPMMTPMAGYGQPMMAPVTAQVQERTGFGLMFDTMRIPMPILRPVAIPRPAEMTMTMPMATAPMVPMMPMMMPGMAMPGMGMGAQAPTGMAQMNVQGSMTAQAAAMMLAASGQLTPQQMAMLALLSGTSTPSTSLTQLAAQVQMSPEALAAALRALQPGSASPSNPPATPPPATPPPAPGTPTSGVTPPPAARPSTPAAAAPANPPTVAALQEQLRQAEQRLRELEELRGRVQK